VDVATLLSPAKSHPTVETTDVGLTVGNSALKMPKLRCTTLMRRCKAASKLSSELFVCEGASRIDNRDAPMLTLLSY